MDLSLVTLMDFGCALMQLGDGRMLLNLACDGADPRLADFIPNKVRGIVEDRDMPESRGVLQYRCPSSKHTPHPGQQKPVDYRTRLCR